MAFSRVRMKNTYTTLILSIHFSDEKWFSRTIFSNGTGMKYDVSWHRYSVHTNGMITNASPLQALIFSPDYLWWAISSPSWKAIILYNAGILSKMSSVKGSRICQQVTDFFWSRTKNLKTSREPYRSRRYLEVRKSFKAIAKYRL